ncbi:site-specific integrase [Prochlorococcus marinus]|nr:site-specific integrase [Prochlorococcus marinus]
MRRPPSLRNNNGALQVRVRLEGKDHFINRLGRWDDLVAVARAQALSARIWSDAKTGSLDLSLKRYRYSVLAAADLEIPVEMHLEEVLRVKAERSRQAVVIHAHRTLLRFGSPLRTAAEVEVFAEWMRAEGLSVRTIVGVLDHCRSCSGSQKHLFEAVLKKRVHRRSVHSDVLSAEEIQAVLWDLQSKEPWFYPLFLLWLSTGLRNGEIRGLTWDCVRWHEGELLVCKTLRRDGFKTGQHSWAPTKIGKERVVPLTAQVLDALKRHQIAMKELDLHYPNCLVFVTPNSHGVVYDQLLGRVWKRSLNRCGLQPRRLYSQRHSFLSHALAMGNSPADLAAAAGHSTKVLLDTYAKPTGRLRSPNWQSAAG